MLFSVIMQVCSDVIPEQISQVTNYSGDKLSPWLVVAVIAILNIVLCIVQWFINSHVKNMDIKIFRKNEINKISIKIGAELYNRLLCLSNYQSGNSHELLEALIRTTTFKEQNKLYLSKNLLDISEKILDYFGVVVHDIRKKDITLENQFLEKYRTEYYG